MYIVCYKAAIANQEHHSSLFNYTATIVRIRQVILQRNIVILGNLIITAAQGLQPEACRRMVRLTT
jgi:hypothetical protein